MHQNYHQKNTADPKNLNNPTFAFCIISLWIQNFMNFDSQLPVDTLLGRLLAFVIMFEKKIEFLKCKLAGNEEFHTRLAFQMLDAHKNNQITAQNIYHALRMSGNGESEPDCQFFIRRYSKNAGLAYEEFLRLMTPKGNKILSQRIMIRTYRKGAVLEQYLFKTLLELLQHYVKMSVITESIRKAIQKNQDLSHLEIIQFFHQRISNPHALIAFLSRCDQDGQQYDIAPEDALYLSYHIRSGNQLAEFTDLDIKELICPIDMSFQRSVPTRDTFYREANFTQDTKYQTKGTNFLGKTYQRIYPQPSHIKSSQPKNHPAEATKKNDPQGNYMVVNTNRLSSRIDNSTIHEQSYGGLYIDNFARSDVRSNLQLNRYTELQLRRPKDDVVVFEDDLSNHSSVSKGSAFDRS